MTNQITTENHFTTAFSTKFNETASNYDFSNRPFHHRTFRCQTNLGKDNQSSPTDSFFKDACVGLVGLSVLVGSVCLIYWFGFFMIVGPWI